MWSITNIVLESSGVSSFNVVTGPASAAVNNIAVYSSLTGKAISTATSGIGTIGGCTLANSPSPLTFKSFEHAYNPNFDKCHEFNTKLIFFHINRTRIL